MLSAVVLAAGMSARMGKNKLLLEFRTKPLIAHAVDTLLASEVDEVVVVLGHEAEKIRDKLQRKRVRLVQNPHYREGLSTSVRAGVRAVSPQAEAIMIYLADQPLLESADVNFIVRAFTYAKTINKRIVVPFFNGQRGNPVILDSSYKEAILGLIGDVGCRGVIKRYPDEVFLVEMENDHVVRDVDNADDFQQVLLSAQPKSNKN
ncbi:MAG TPA: nucleotidyltransferase family protein [Chthoniobacterales bacterium]|nr:nucleotidyltransferase family protein [Chthoniobacterales bacterium]